MAFFNLEHIPAAGDTVVYGTNGVCRVREISKQDFAGMGQPKTYLILEQVDNEGSVSFVPADNEELLSRLRLPMSTEKANRIAENADEAPLVLSPDRKERTAFCRALLNEAEPVSLLSLIRAFRVYEKDLLSKHRRLSYADADFFETALRILKGELLLVLGDGEKVSAILASGNAN